MTVRKARARSWRNKQFILTGVSGWSNYRGIWQDITIIKGIFLPQPQKHTIMAFEKLRFFIFQSTFLTFLRFKNKIASNVKTKVENSVFPVRVPVPQYFSVPFQTIGKFTQWTWTFLARATGQIFWLCLFLKSGDISLYNFNALTRPYVN